MNENLIKQRQRDFDHRRQVVEQVCAELGDGWRPMQPEPTSDTVFPIAHSDSVDSRLRIDFGSHDGRIAIRSWPPDDLRLCLDRNEVWPQITVDDQADAARIAHQIRDRLIGPHCDAIAKATFWANTRGAQRQRAEDQVAALRRSWPADVEVRSTPQITGKLMTAYAKPIADVRSPAQWSFASSGDEKVELQLRFITPQLAAEIVALVARSLQS